jgi:hypothetical protein
MLLLLRSAVSSVGTILQVYHGLHVDADTYLREEVSEPIHVGHISHDFYQE